MNSGRWPLIFFTHWKTSTSLSVFIIFSKFETAMKMPHISTPYLGKTFSITDINMDFMSLHLICNYKHILKAQKLSSTSHQYSMHGWTTNKNSLRPKLNRSNTTICLWRNYRHWTNIVEHPRDCCHFCTVLFISSRSGIFFSFFLKLHNVSIFTVWSFSCQKKNEALIIIGNRYFLV